MVNLFDIEDKETNKIKVIGEGAYGCVHKPSLKCSKTKEPMKYRNKISKILLKDDAIEEMNEYNIIANIDKNNGFFLGKPTMCSVKQTNENMNAISKCEKGYEFLKKIDNTQLLIMDYGGDNLDTVSQEFSKMKKTKSNVNKVKKFFGKAHRLLLGIKFLNDNNIIHHDMKPQNIVYNKKDNHVNFIDFGFTTYKSDLKEYSIKSRNTLANCHWSYPLDICYMNYDIYMSFAKLSPNKKMDKFDEMMHNLKMGENDKCTMAISILMTYICEEHLNSSKKNKILELYMNDYKKMILKEIIPNNYKKFLNKSLETMDLYGLGIAFFLIVNACKHLLPKELIYELKNLCYYMTCFDLNKRYDTDTTIYKYEEILNKYKIPIYVDTDTNTNTYTNTDTI